MSIKSVIQKKIFGYRYDSGTLVNYLKSQGIKIGDNVKFFSPRTTIIDIQRPYLLEIGSGAKITGNVTILTHDFSYSVLRIKYHDLLGECSGKTIIGENVFIGMGSTIMPGVHIGNNCIIGAGSVVTKDIPNDSVAVGNPARVISSIEDFYNKRKERQVSDAFRLARLYREKYGVDPGIKDMGSFFPLFLPRDKSLLEKYQVFTKLSGDNESELIEDWLNTQPAFSSFEEFLEKSKEKTKNETV